MQSVRLGSRTGRSHLTRRVKWLRPFQHLHKQLNLSRPGLGLLHRLDTKQNRIAIGAIETRKELLGFGIRIQRCLQVGWHERTAWGIVCALPPSALLRALDGFPSRRL